MDQAIATLFGVLIGGLITFATNYWTESKKSKNEEKKRQEERKSQENKLRYEAYTKFLSIEYHQAHLQIDIDGDTGEPICGEFRPELIEGTVALVLTYGSPRVASLLAKGYPFKDWSELDGAKRTIMQELVVEKGGTL